MYSMSYTIGELATALSGIADSLDRIAGEINRCDMKTEVDTTPGRTAICSGPVIVATACRSMVPETFTVGDLAETVEGLRDWVRDVSSKLSNYAPSAPIDVAPWPSTGA
jgi:hypothetical protein